MLFKRFEVARLDYYAWTIRRDHVRAWVEGYKGEW